jgi:hypothetical protein
MPNNVCHDWSTPFFILSEDKSLIKPTAINNTVPNIAIPNKISVILVVAANITNAITATVNPNINPVIPLIKFVAFLTSSLSFLLIDLIKPLKKLPIFSPCFSLNLDNPHKTTKSDSLIEHNALINEINPFNRESALVSLSTFNSSGNSLITPIIGRKKPAKFYPPSAGNFFNTFPNF